MTVLVQATADSKTRASTTVFAVGCRLVAQCHSSSRCQTCRNEFRDECPDDDHQQADDNDRGERTHGMTILLDRRLIVRRSGNRRRGIGGIRGR